MATAEKEAPEVELSPVEKKIEALADEVRAELAVVEPHYNRLRVSLQRLTGDGVQAPSPTRAAPRRAASNGSGSGSRAGVDRLGEFMAVVNGDPGLSIPEITKRMGLDSPNYLYRLRNRAQAEGLIRQDEAKKIFPASTAA